MWDCRADTYNQEYRSQEGIGRILTFMHFQLGISTTTQSWKKELLRYAAGLKCLY